MFNSESDSEGRVGWIWTEVGWVCIGGGAGGEDNNGKGKGAEYIFLEMDKEVAEKIANMLLIYVSAVIIIGGKGSSEMMD